MEKRWVRLICFILLPPNGDLLFPVTYTTAGDFNNSRHYLLIKPQSVVLLWLTGSQDVVVHHLWTSCCAVSVETSHPACLDVLMLIFPLHPESLSGPNIQMLNCQLDIQTGYSQMCRYWTWRKRSGLTDTSLQRCMLCLKIASWLKFDWVWFLPLTLRLIEINSRHWNRLLFYFHLCELQCSEYVSYFTLLCWRLDP